ncbi:PASTA domain-containing protein [Sulfurovum sp. CS9]|uniref:PASTA domain-containing protein n=1 Tax=Sulfurovum sp. CS9 TaxID=3391146 RepID=UPI0039EC94E6
MKWIKECKHQHDLLKKCRTQCQLDAIPQGPGESEGDCAKHEKWLSENARACGDHGNRLPSICSNDPVCIAWNKACKHQHDLLNVCLARQKEAERERVGVRVRTPNPEECRHQRKRLIEKSPERHAQGIIGWATAVLGDVEIDLCTGGVVPMHKKIPIRVGDCIRTGKNGRMRIEFQTGILSEITGDPLSNSQRSTLVLGASLYLSRGSEMCFNRFIPEPSEMEAWVDFIKGKVRAILKGGESSIRIRTGNTVCSIRGVDVSDVESSRHPSEGRAYAYTNIRGADVAVSHQPSTGSVYVYVNDGHANIQSMQNGQKVALKAGEKITAERGAFGSVVPLSQLERSKLTSGDELDFGEDFGDRPNGSVLTDFKDPWLDSLKNTQGMSVGSPGPRYPELGKEKPKGTKGEIPVDPNSSNVATHIRDWMNNARPPRNAVPGANVRYSPKGNMMDSVPGGTIRSTHDEGMQIDPVFLWKNKRSLDSVDHCTLEEYVIAKLKKQSIEKCRGRYQGIGDLRGKSVADAKDKLNKTKIKYTVKEETEAPSKEKEGTIEKHTPGPNSWFKRGKTVELVKYGPYTYFDEAMTAVNKCKFKEAEKYIAKMPAGSKKEKIEKKFKVAKKLEDTIITLVMEAYKEARIGNYRDGLSLLNKALSMATCDKHRKNINKKIAQAKKIIEIYTNAKAALQSCDFKKAKSFIAQMPDDPKKSELEQEYQEAKKLEDTIITLVMEAHRESRIGNYRDGLSLLNKALGMATCDKHRDIIEKKIATGQDSKKKADELIADARTNIQACRFDSAKEQIDKIPTRHSIRRELDKEYRTSIKNRDKIKALVKKANKQYRLCEYDKALATLNKASNKVRCADQNKTIKDEIASVQKAKKNEDKRKTLVSDADREHKNCEFDKALSILNDALNIAECKKHRESITNKIADFKEAKAHEETTKNLFREAKNFYRNADYDSALAKLQQAYNHTRCDKNKDSITKKIAEVKDKSREEAFREIPSVVGKKVEEAKQLIINAGLVPSVIKDKNATDENKENSVYKQEPVAGSKVEAGTGVTIYVFGKYVSQGVRANECPQCTQYEVWLSENANACYYHGARQPLICESDPECVRWNTECKRQKDLLKQCSTQCQLDAIPSGPRESERDCAKHEAWLHKNAGACGYHGARPPSICENDPVCVQWNKECKRQKDLLQKCREKVVSNYDSAKVALKSCDFEKARRLINQVPAGPGKSELEQEYQAAVELKNAIKVLVANARRQAEAGNYADALPLLREALDKAICENHRKSIIKWIAKVEEKLEPSLQDLVARKDCSRYGNGVAVEAYWNASEKKAECRCKSGYMLSGGVCVAASESPGKPYVVLFDLNLVWPTNLPEAKEAPRGADAATRKRIQEENKRRLTRALQNFRIENSVMMPIAKMTGKDVFFPIHISGGALSKYPRRLFSEGSEFSLPFKGNYIDKNDGNQKTMEGALLLKTVKTFDNIDQAIAVYPDLKEQGQKSDDFLAGWKFTNRSGSFDLQNRNGSFRIGPLERGWSDRNKRKALELTKHFIENFSINFDCFIATAVYTNPMASELFTLRSFRDNVLLSSEEGRRIVDIYYRHGPALAQRVKEYPAISDTVRFVLDQFVGWLESADLSDSLSRKILDSAVVVTDKILLVFVDGESKKEPHETANNSNRSSLLSEKENEQ